MKNVNLYKKNIILFFLLTILILLLDIYSKQWIMNNYFLRNKDHIILFFNFRYTYNPGNLFLCYVKYSCNSIKILFISIISILYVLIIMFISNKYLYINKIIFYAFIIGGALGNISNRIIYGVVIDFIDIYNFPTFNIADYVIFIGTIYLNIIYYFGEYFDKKSDVSSCRWN